MGPQRGAADPPCAWREEAIKAWKRQRWTEIEVRTTGIADAHARKIYPMLKDRHPNVGSEGGLSGWLAKKREACREAERSGDIWKLFTAEPDKGHARMLGAFVEEIRGLRKEPVSPVESALRATRICLDGVKSALEKRMEDIAEV